MPCCSSVSTTSSPASTPRLPSKRPPVATVSMCEPHITGAASGSVPGRVGHDVADGVDRHVEPEVAHPADDEVAAVPVGVGQGEAGAALLAVGTLDRTDLAELDEPRPQPVAVDAEVLPPHRRRRSLIGGGTRRSRRARRRTRRRRRRTARRRARRWRRSGRRCGRRRRSRWRASRTRRRPPKRTYRLPARCSGTRRTAADMSTSSGARWSMIDVSLRPPWMPMPSSSAVDVAALVRRQARMGEERHQPVVQAQLAVGDVDERAVAAVAVEEHEALRPGSSRCTDRGRRGRRAASTPTATPCPATRRARWTWCRRAAAAARRRARRRRARRRPSATRSAISRSVLNGRCGPCCSVAPSGCTMTLRSVRQRAMSGRPEVGQVSVGGHARTLPADQDGPREDAAGDSRPGRGAARRDRSRRRRRRRRPQRARHRRLPRRGPACARSCSRPARSSVARRPASRSPAPASTSATATT